MEPEGLELKKLVDGKWKNLVAARQKREALDKLRDKQQQSHNHQAERNEQLTMDEMASLRASSPRMT
jgi:flagellar export protein FliJ